MGNKNFIIADILKMELYTETLIVKASGDPTLKHKRYTRDCG